MKILGIDASGKTAACAVCENDTVIAKSFTESTLTHSQTLLPLIDSTLVAAELNIESIDAFAFTAGPGSFTGLRIGAATIMGLAGNKPCYPVSTLLAIAYNFLDSEAIILPCLDARRNQVYTAAFKVAGGKVTRLYDDCAMAVCDVLQKISTDFNDCKVIIAGDGCYLFEQHDLPDNVNLATGEQRFASGQGIIKAALEGSPLNAQDIKLNYLRLSQAERELKERQK